jgi:hypothetical protein
MTDFPKTTVAYSDSANIDAFGRLRVSQKTNLISVMQTFDELPYVLDTEILGAASSTYDYSRSSSLMATSGSDAFVIRQTYERSVYIPGTSLTNDWTFSNFQVEPNIIKRVGSFTSNFVTPFSGNLDGLFLESDPIDGYTVNIWCSGSQIERTAQQDWNTDPLDGTGISGISASFTDSQIFAVDLQWLGVGRVRWGFVIGGEFVQVHESNHANEGLTRVYMREANKPLRWEIRQTGAGSGALEQICAASQIEGSLRGTTKSVSVNFGSTKLDLATAKTRYLVAAVRAESGKESARIFDTILSFYSATNDSFLYEVLLNPTFSAPLTWVPISFTNGEAALGDESITVSAPENTVVSGYFIGKSTIDVNFGYDDARFGTAIDGTRDIIAICATPLGAGADLYYAATSKVFV